MKVWVTRDKNRAGCVCIWRQKPEKESAPIVGVYYDKKNNSANFPFYIFDDEFKKGFGFTPRKGSCKQMNLSLTEIE